MKRPNTRQYSDDREYIMQLEYYIDYLEDRLEEAIRKPIFKDGRVKESTLKLEPLDPSYILPYNPSKNSIDEFLAIAEELWKDVEVVPKKERRIPVNITIDKVESLGWKHTDSEYECDQYIFYFPKCKKGWSYWIDIRNLNSIYLSFDENDGMEWFAPRYILQGASIEDSIAEIERIMKESDIIKVTDEEEI